MDLPDTAMPVTTEFLRPEGTDTLRAQDAFRSLRPDLLQRIDRFGVVESMEPGDVLFLAGRDVQQFMVVIEGTVEILGYAADRWIGLVHGEAKAVDAVVKFAKSAPLAWQTTSALTWIEAIIGGRFDSIANHLWDLEDWLTHLRSGGAIIGGVKSR
jgi:hypothetical protein